MTPSRPHGTAPRHAPPAVPRAGRRVVRRDGRPSSLQGAPRRSRARIRAAHRWAPAGCLDRPAGRRRAALRHRAGHGRLGLVGDLHRHLRHALGDLDPRGDVDGDRHRCALASDPRRLPAVCGASARRCSSSPSLSSSSCSSRVSVCTRGLEPLGRLRPVPPAAVRADEAGADALRRRLHRAAPRRGRHRPPHHRAALAGDRLRLRPDPGPARHGHRHGAGMPRARPPVRLGRPARPGHEGDGRPGRRSP